MIDDKKLRSLIEFVRFQCLCPCCEQDYECDPECTFAEDCPDEHAKMMEAREALYG